MSYSLDEAKSAIYEMLLVQYDGVTPEDTPIIFDEATITKPWGWVFFYNNKRYYQTRDFRWQWVGPGPIFFNRHTAGIREFGSGANLEHALYDYEMELAAKNGSWCLWLTDNQDRKQTIVNLKGAFVLTTLEAMQMLPTLPYCLFSGLRRHLDWVSTCLTEYDIKSQVTLELSADSAHAVFKLPEWVVNPTLAEAFHERWDVEK